MDFAFMLALLALTFGIGLCAGFMIGETAAHDKLRARRKHWESRIEAAEDRSSDTSCGVRFHR